ncbi:MAG: hypothetical protein RXR31_07895 [Thermoproteota archaeon]
MNEEEKEQLKKEILEELEKYIDNKLSKIDNDIYSIGEEIIEIENRLDKIRKILKDHDLYTDKYYWW